MDPIAHTFVGAALAQTGLRKRSAYAGAALVIGANLPDVDAVAMLVDRDTALLVRRGWTHGVPALVVLPFVLTGLVLLWSRLGERAPDAAPLRPKVLLALSALAVATHPALDWLNTYGMRWLMPLDGRWFYGDTLFIIDPWMWLVLGGAVFLHFSRHRSSLLAWGAFAAFAAFLLFGVVPGLLPAKAAWTACVALLAVLRVARVGQNELGARRLAAGALTLVAIYIGATFGVARHARSLVASDLASRGIEVVELMVGPVPVTPFVKDVVAGTPSGYRYGRATLLPRFELDLVERRLPRLEDSNVPAALASHEVRGFVNWARFPFAEVERSEAGVTVYLLDARYTRSRAEGFGATRLDLGKEEAETLGTATHGSGR